MANPASRASQDQSGTSGSPAASAPTQHPADLAALTGRDDFLLELGEVLGGRASVHPAESIDAALEQLSHARNSRLLVIDARNTGDVRANVQQAAERVPGIVILVFAEEQTEKEVAAALKGTKVFAVLPLPVEHTKTTAVLDAALDGTDQDITTQPRSAAGMAQPARAPQSMRPQRPMRPELAPESSDSPARSSMLWVGLGVAVIAAAGGATWYLTRGKGPVPSTMPKSHTAAAMAGHVAAAPQPVVDTSIVQGRVDDLLDRARHAMFERHFTTPKGANALVYYRSVLAVDPTNGEALDGLRRVGNVLGSRFHDAMSRSQFPAAALALATLKVAQPTNAKIGVFQRQLYVGEISQALAGSHPGQAAALLAQATQAGVPAAQLSSLQAQLTKQQQSKQTQSLATQILSDIRKDNLTGPTGAEAALARLRSIAPTSAATRHAGKALIDALLTKAQQDAVAGKTADEKHWLATAKSNGVTTKYIAAFQKRLAAQQARAAQARIGELLVRARARIQSGELTMPAADSAAHYLQAVESTHPTGASLAAVERARGELAAKLLARAESEAHAGKTTASQADLAQAHQWGATAPQINSVKRSIRVALHEASQPSAADLRQLASQLVRVRYEAPSYPDFALSRRIAGEVTVQYVVDKKGVPRNVHVISANPSKVFNYSALDAIRSWRYKPVKFRGHPVQVPVRTRIKFVLPN